MDQNARNSLIGLAALLLAVTVFPLACGGDGDNFQRAEVAELGIEEPSAGQIDLELPPDEDRAQVQSPPITLRNTGLADLRVTRLELLNTPASLVAWSRTEESCTMDSDCDQSNGEQICLQAANCVAVGLPEAPLTITPGDGVVIETLIRRGSTEIECPEAPADIEPEFAEFYCGELVVETNATNNAGNVENGAARIVFLRPNTSGRISVNPQFIEFDNVQPGSSASQEFSIQNTGSTPLTVEQISITDRGNFFSITGSTSFPTVIESDENETWTLSLEIPSSATPEEYEGFTDLVIDSSAGSSTIPVNVTAEAAASPDITISQSTLKFDQQTSQTITIESTGETTLIVNRLRVDPSEAADFYTFEYQGNDVTDSFPNTNIARGDSIDITVNFDASASTESSVGILTIGHNVRAKNNRSEVILLGDAGDVPIARVYPIGFTFLADESNTADRTFVLRNIGTAPLDVSAVNLMFVQGSDAEFTVTGIPANIPAGGIATGMVNFQGANASPDIGNAVFTTNDDVGELLLSIKDVTSSGEVIVPQVTPLFANDARVGRTASFTAADTTPAESAGNALWTLLERPAGSEVFFFVANEELSFVPDVAGTYRFSLLVAANDREAEEIYELTVVE